MHLVKRKGDYAEVTLTFAYPFFLTYGNRSGRRKTRVNTDIKPRKLSFVVARKGEVL